MYPALCSLTPPPSCAALGEADCGVRCTRLTSLVDSRWPLSQEFFICCPASRSTFPPDPGMAGLHPKESPLWRVSSLPGRPMQTHHAPYRVPPCGGVCSQRQGPTPVTASSRYLDSLALGLEPAGPRRPGSWVMWLRLAAEQGVAAWYMGYSPGPGGLCPKHSALHKRGSDNVNRRA